VTPPRVEEPEITKEPEIIYPPKMIFRKDDLDKFEAKFKAVISSSRMTGTMSLLYMTNSTTEDEILEKLFSSDSEE